MAREEMVSSQGSSGEWDRSLVMCAGDRVGASRFSMLLLRLSVFEMEVVGLCMCFLLQSTELGSGVLSCSPGNTCCSPPSFGG